MAKLLLSLCTRAVGRQLGIQSPRREVAHVTLQESHWKGTSCKQKSAVSLWAGWTQLLRHAHSPCKFLRPNQEDSPVLYHPVHMVMQPKFLRKLQTDCNIMLYSSNTAACIRDADLGPFQGKKLFLWAGRSLPRIQRCRRRWLLNWVQLACWSKMPSQRHVA